MRVEYLFLFAILSLIAIDSSITDRFLDSIRVSGNANAGDTIPVTVILKPEGEEDISISASIPELGVFWKTGTIDPFGRERTKLSRTLFLDIPYYAERGEYLVRVVVNSENEKRIKHRWISVQ